MFDANDAARTRRMHEIIGTNRDRDVRRAPGDRREEHQIARRDVISANRRPQRELIANLSREGHAVLSEYVLRESAAVEPCRVCTAVSVRGAYKLQCRGRQSVQAIVVVARFGRGRAVCTIHRTLDGRTRVGEGARHSDPG